MSFKLLGGGSDLATVVSDVNQNILELKGRELTEFFKDDSGTRRVLLGKGADGFYGLKVSPEGTDVYTATDAELIFNSDQNVFKILDKPTVSFSISSGAGGATSSFFYDHNLGYRPLVLAAATMTGSGFLNGITGLFILPFLQPALSSGSGGVGPWGTIAGSISINLVTETRIWFNYLLAPNAGLEGTITMYILQETAN